MFVRTDSEMREWLSGGVSPCQGEGRGFESRLALNKKEDGYVVTIFFFIESRVRPSRLAREGFCRSTSGFYFNVLPHLSSTTRSRYSVNFRTILLFVMYLEYPMPMIL